MLSRRVAEFKSDLPNRRMHIFGLNDLVWRPRRRWLRRCSEKIIPIEWRSIDQLIWRFLRKMPLSLAFAASSCWPHRVAH